MNWDDVRIFLAVARAGQILAASRRLELNHATVGRRVSALEASLGSKLLIRRTNGCDLTPEGEAFLHAAERMEAEMLSARASVGMTDMDVSGTVRIGATDGYGVSFLSPRLGKLAARYPGLKIQLVPVPQSFSLSRREADILITVDRPDAGRLITRKLVDYTLALFASKTYAAEHGLPESEEALKQHRLIGYVEDLIISPQLHYRSEFARNWESDFEISAVLGQVEAVRAGAGIGILHTFLARPHKDLVPVLPKRRVERSYWIVYHENLRDIRRVKAVVDFIAEETDQSRDKFV
ncbi:LysR family transcriptional regulator [Hoeflea prorocentri]|uniref:LysR family transcriptional regulator n=1 Tax=Hoeflea prorocentri TaxID=1922333 RepID=A0A9X3UJV5_9HYPH|nr:LysR family transcriptional regulator [Hoeflea prorocentri]MCY6382682.1 LysR family transcriptional regulator [Hoeflea prorocentri]MDA5400482.1 LysR family transcriptional regulator [Hoeflea prorocentri]